MFPFILHPKPIIGGVRSTLPQNLMSAAGEVIEGFEEKDDWTPSATATITDDTGKFTQGVQSVNIAASGSDANGTKTIDLDLSSKNAFMRIDLYLSSSTSSPTIYLTSVTNLSKFFSKQISGNYLRAGWNRVSIAASEWTNTGSESWANRMIRLRVRHDSTGQNICFDNMKAGLTQQGAILFSFDDGFSEIYDNAYPILAAKHMPANANIVSDLANTAGYMTSLQLQTLYLAGWDLCNHTKDHTNLDNLTEPQIETNISACKDFLDGLGCTRASNHLVYTAGSYCPDTLTALTNLGWPLARYGGSPVTDRCFILLPQIDLYQVPAIQIDPTVSLATAEAIVDEAVAGGKVIIFYTHKITDTPGSGDWLTSNFDSLTDYVLASGLPVLTSSQLLALESGPVSVTLPYE